MRIEIIKNTLLLMFCSFFLAACGSSGDDPEPAPEPGPVIQKAILTVNGAPAEGARYDSTGGSQNPGGNTTAAGEFDYEEGTTVRFYIGSTLLGSVSDTDGSSGANFNTNPGMAARLAPNATITIESLIEENPAATPGSPLANLAALLAANQGAGASSFVMPASLETVATATYSAILKVNGAPAQGAVYSSTGGSANPDGTTAANGAFTYEANTTINFYIGSTLIGSVQGPSLTPNGELTIESLLASNSAATSGSTLASLPNLLALNQGTGASTYTLPASLTSLVPDTYTATLKVNNVAAQGAVYNSSNGYENPNGTTPASGEFIYEAYTTVSFYIGSTLLGSMPASGITPNGTITIESLLASNSAVASGSDLANLPGLLAFDQGAGAIPYVLPSTLASLVPTTHTATLKVNGVPAQSVIYSSVNGLENLGGATPASGEFTYEADSTVSFYIGSTLIGSVAAANITPNGSLTIESLLASNSAATSGSVLAGLPNLLIVDQGSSTSPYIVPNDLTALNAVVNRVLTLNGNPISGVSYISGSTTNTTTQNGEFIQDGSNSITFAVAGISLGTVNTIDLPTSIEALAAADISGYPVAKNMAALLNELNAPGASNPTAVFRRHDLEQQLLKPASNLIPANRVLGMNMETPQAEADWINQPLMFADLFRVSRPFEEQSCSGVSFDSNGWPTSISPSCATLAYNLSGNTQVHSKYAFTRILQYSTLGSFPAGRYTVLYDGIGELKYSGMGCNKISVEPNGHDTVDIAVTNACANPSDPNSVTTNVNNWRGLEITVTLTNPSDPVRNIRVVMPGGICKGNPFARVAGGGSCNSADEYVSFAEMLKANRNAIAFNPDFLNFAKDFRVLRTMNMMEATPRRPESNVINPCPDTSPSVYQSCLTEALSWGSRVNMDSAHWGGSYKTNVRKRQGVPLEVGIALANTLEAHPWFNIPFNADDNFVEEYATLIADELKDDLQAHIEYSNEIWNAGFWGHHYAQAKGLADPTISAMSVIPFRDANYSARTRYTAKRSKEIFTAFEAEFGGTTRLKRILGGQNKFPALANDLLSYDNTASKTDAFAIAPYFHGCWSRKSINGQGQIYDHPSCSNTTTVPRTLSEVTSVNQIFEIMDGVYHDTAALPADKGDSNNLDATIKLLGGQANVASSHNVDLYAYEGGQHLTINWNEANTAGHTYNDPVTGTSYVLDEWGTGAASTNAQLNSLKDLIDAANRDPRMKDRYTTLLEGWKNAGAKLFVMFTAPQTFNRYGDFGIKENLNSPREDSPKYDALLDFQDEVAGCWPGYVTDGC